MPFVSRTTGVEVAVWCSENGVEMDLAILVKLLTACPDDRMARASARFALVAVDVVIECTNEVPKGLVGFLWVHPTAGAFVITCEGQRSEPVPRLAGEKPGVGIAFLRIADAVKLGLIWERNVSAWGFTRIETSTPHASQQVKPCGVLIIVPPQR